ncbi:hypothetical protein GCM10022381_37040 [Leifsonia kafniensis]|uniref:Uncharacterized protein n=1 Tax=Leifsonia kafniensis TaxID=475957 RepID=A0ABP7KZ88_9MICO
MLHITRGRRRHPGEPGLRTVDAERFHTILNLEIGKADARGGFSGSSRERAERGAAGDQANSNGERDDGVQS